MMFRKYSIFIFLIMVSVLTYVFLCASPETKEIIRGGKEATYKEQKKMDSKIVFKKYIRADLQAMKIYTHDYDINGKEIVKEYPLVSKGKPGSYYETPAGEFAIKSKVKNKFSSIGHVYMPYAMQFYGNFFIHGIPYYPDGKKVATTYSGGCLRVGDKDILEIYNFANAGTELIIENNNEVDRVFKSNILTKEKAENMLSVLFSLEFMNQEKEIVFDNSMIKIKDLNYLIAKDNREAKQVVYNYLGKKDYDKNTRERLQSMGITESFDKQENLDKFLNYVMNNKRFLLTYFN